MKTSIVILTYNNLKLTKLCIDSIRKFTKVGSYEIIIVDNNSSDDTVNWIKKQKDIKGIFNEINMGFPAGCNQGIKISVGDNVLLLNNDTIVTKNYLTNMIDCLYSDVKIGAVGCVTNNCSNYQAINAKYNNIEELIKFAENHNVRNKELWEDRLRLVGFCMLIKKEVINKIGLIDEIFTPGNFEDDDYSYRIITAGYRLVLCKDTYIHHAGGASFRKDPSSFNELLKINNDKFIEKWGFSQSYSTNIRFDIINLISKPLDSNFNVLEVGCACGATLLEIKNKYKNAKIFGIELNENAARIAKCFADVRTGNIEKETLDYDLGSFDFIIFADVLEYLYNPDKVLENIKKYLKPDGYILASIPNVMHYNVLENLLNGNWTNEDAGILDRTHVSFFTLNRIDNLFTKLGYELIKYSATEIQKKDADIEFIEKLCSITNSGLKLQYEAYQYLVKVQNSPKIDSLVKKVECKEVPIYQNNLDKLSNLKYILKKIENEVEKESSEEKLINLIADKEVLVEDIIYVVNRDIIQKNRILNDAAVLCYEAGLFDDILPLLGRSFELDKTHRNTIYNLGYVLSELGEKELALSYLNGCLNKDTDEEMLNLISEISCELE